MQNNMKHNNIHIIGIPKGEEEEHGIENLFEKVLMENFHNLMREKVTQIQETQRVLIKRNPERPTSRHIIIKMVKSQDKERILKTRREKQGVTYRGAPIRVAAGFSMETHQARREWQNIFQVMKTRGLQLIVLYLAMLSMKMEGQIRTSQTKEASKNIPPPKQLSRRC